jgi:GT2 family glycosyltransferase
VDSIRQVLEQEPPADEVLVVDQTARHEPPTSQALTAWHQRGRIRWVRHSPPGLPGARNRALLEARSDIVIFIDDDVILAPGFVEAHRRSYEDARVVLVSGQVLRKNREVHSGPADNADVDFPFSHNQRAWIRFMHGGNCSVRRGLALELGGFDERYFQGSYREEADFAARAVAQSGRMALFEPRASLVHLAEPMGGCRSWGSIHAPLAAGWARGDYYFALMNLPLGRMMRHIARRFFRSGANRYCLRHPWAIPPILAREVVGFAWAVLLSVQGRKLIPLGARRGEGPCGKIG